VNKWTWARVSSLLIGVAWAFFFFSLTVTSFPYLPEELGGRTLVRPLAVYPLIVLIFLVTFPRLIKRPLPQTFLPLLAFALVAMISSLAAFTSDLDVYRGVSLVERFLRNLLTLGLGMAFYLTVALLPKSWEDLRFSMRWLYAGFAVALAWGTLQIPYVIHFHQKYFKLINSFQSYISTRKLFTTRISGLTYEPKWFAEQICFLLMPWLLSSVLNGRSVFPWRYRWITVEWFLLAWSAVVLVFTYSRTGLFILGVLAFVSYWLYRARSLRAGQQAASPGRRAAWRTVEAFALLALLAGGIYFVGSQNAYFSRLWRYWTEGKARTRTYLEFIAFEQRFVYWATALNIYHQNPALGVGLGNYAFYFPEMLPNQPYDEQREVMRQITPGEGRDRLITPKNLYARLIAETGLLGTVLFSLFLLAILGCALYLWFSPHPEQKYWAMSGFLSLVVFAILVFSFDSFSIPNMWVVFGLITAAAHLDDPSTSQVEPRVS
jgi:hypothetical protein